MIDSLSVLTALCALCDSHNNPGHLRLTVNTCALRIPLHQKRESGSDPLWTLVHSSANTEPNNYVSAHIEEDSRRSPVARCGIQPRRSLNIETAVYRGAYLCSLRTT